MTWSKVLQVLWTRGSHTFSLNKNDPDASLKYSLWSVKLATIFSVTGGFGNMIHVEYMDLVPELGW